MDRFLYLYLIYQPDEMSVYKYELQCEAEGALLEDVGGMLPHGLAVDEVVDPLRELEEYLVRIDTALRHLRPPGRVVPVRCRTGPDRYWVRPGRHWRWRPSPYRCRHRPAGRSARWSEWLAAAARMALPVR